MNVLGIGEILWDVVDDEKHLGGAPFNVLAHLRKMGHRSNLFSAIGRDTLGQEIKQSMKRLLINDHWVHENDFPTSTVSVTLIDGQPDYLIHENVAWDHLQYDQGTKNAIQNETFDLVVFGMLAQRNDDNANTIYEIIKDANAGHIFFDVNIRKHYYTAEKIKKSLSICTMLKLNEDEMMLIRSMFYDPDVDLPIVVEFLAKDFNIKLICVTRGGDGAWVYAGKRWYKEVAPKVHIADTIGAGDSFSAAFLHNYLRSHDIPLALKTAVTMGAFVASKSGAIPEYSEEIKKYL